MGTTYLGTPMSSSRVLLGLLLTSPLAGCEAPAEPESTPRSAVGVDVGLRVPLDVPVQSLEGVCPPSVQCSLSDVDGDGKADLVQRDGSGTLSVGLSQGFGFGPLEPIAEGCDEGHVCIVADLDDIRGAELLTIDRGLGSVTAEGLSTHANEPPTFDGRMPAEEGFCPEGSDRCGPIAFDDVPGAELAWIDEGGLLRILPLEGEPLELQTECEDGRGCTFVEFDGIRGAELLSWGGQGGPHWTPLFGDSQLEPTLHFDCNDDTPCSFVDLDGDGRTDVLQPTDEGMGAWLSSRDWEVAVPLSPQAATCGLEERCIWADVNGDRVSDLVRFQPNGDVSLHPSFDAPGRLQAATLAFSRYVSDQSRLRSSQPAVADSHADFVATRGWLRARVENALADVRANMPTESDVTDDEDVRRIQQLSLYIAVARTVLAAGPVGSSLRAESCGNLVLHEASDTGLTSPSYLFAYADALRTRDHGQQVPEMVDALTALVSGFRCLNHEELADIDLAFSEAILETADELFDDGQELAARWLLDNSLPIALLTFDVTKYESLPASYRLFSARMDTSGVEPGDVPHEGFDFAHAADDPGCETFVCQSYDLPRRATVNGRGLRLDRLGVWLPDPMRSNRLQRVNVDPLELLRELHDLRNFGEGDCALFEVVATRFSCPSKDTCDGPGVALDIPRGALPGAPGHTATHLMTPRAGQESHNDCDDTGATGSGAVGGVPMSGCMGPPLDSRRGRFSADPEMDTILRCALETASTPIDFSVDLGEQCLTGQHETAPPVNYDQLTPAEQQDLDEAKEHVTTGLSENTPMRQTFIDGVRANERYSHLTEEQVGRIIDENVVDAVGHATAIDAGGRALGATEPWRVAGELEGTGVYIDVAQHIADLPMGANLPDQLSQTLLHEAVHVFTLFAEKKYGIESDDPNDHAITGSLGLQQCADGPCDNSCGFGDSFIDRFTECIEPTGGVSMNDIQCSFGQDVCGDRRHGDMGFPMTSGCSPSLPPALQNQECFLVQCDIDSGPMASMCCDGGEPEMAGQAIPPFFGPGPMPPPIFFEAYFGDWAPFEKPPGL